MKKDFLFGCGSPGIISGLREVQDYFSNPEFQGLLLILNSTLQQETPSTSHLLFRLSKLYAEKFAMARLELRQAFCRPESGELGRTVPPIGPVNVFTPSRPFSIA